MTGFPTDLDLRELLAEEAFVRRLARGILFDDHRVDDVVQQTWLAAIERPPGDRGSLRAWLAGVVRNIARTELRSSRRRGARERAAALPEGLPSVDDVLLREAERRELLEALRGLPEPYRSTVLLRYFEDHTPKQIAARLGVPAATVRTRLKRGLDLLRQSLDQRHGGRARRAEWCLTLIPLAQPATAAAAVSAAAAQSVMVQSTSTLATKSGALIGMKKALTLGIAALVVILLGVYAWPSTAEPAPVHDDAVTKSAAVDLPEPSGAPDATGAAARKAVAASTRPAGRQTPPDYGASLCGFRGRLIDPDGRPAAGELVRIGGIDGLSFYTESRDLPGPGEAGLAVHTAEARSGDDGVFVVAGLWPGASYALRASVDGGHPHFRTVDRTPGPGEIVDLGDIRLEAKAVLFGVVVGPDGEPIEGAEVWAADVPGMIVSAAAIDRLDPAFGGFIAVPRPVAADLAGAAGGQSADSTDSTDYARRVRSFLGRDMWREVVELDQGFYLAVVDGTAWMRTAFDLLPVARTRTAADGTFRLAGVEPGACMLVARRIGYLTGLEPRVKTTAGAARDVGTIRLRGGQTLHGRVVDHTGAGVTGAEVRAAAVGAFGFRGVAFAEPPAEAGADGAFAFPGLPRGRALVAARRSEDHPWVAIGPIDVDERAVIALPAPQSFELVIDLPAGTPADAVRFDLLLGPMLGELTRAGIQSRLSTERRVQPSGPDTWTVGDLLPGVYTLHVRAPDCAPEAVMVELPARERVELKLRPIARFDVVVSDRNGRPVDGAKVYVQRADPPPWAEKVMPTDYGLPSWRALPSLAGFTDADGRLTVDTLPAGAALCSALHPAEGQAGLRVELPLPAGRPVELTLPGTAAVEGTVLERGAPPRPEDWRVVAFPLGEPSPTGMPESLGHGVLGPDGSYRIEGLAPGPYRIRSKQAIAVRSLGSFVGMVQKQVFGFLYTDRTGNAAEVELAAGEVRRLDFDVDPAFGQPGEATGAIAGSITIDGEAQAGAQVRREKGFLTRETLATVQKDGSFRVEGLAAGEVDLSVSDASGEDTLWSGTVQIVPGAALRLDLRLSAGIVRGTALQPDGRPMSNVDVHFEGELDGGGSTYRRVTTDVAGAFELRDALVGGYTLSFDKDDMAAERKGVAVAPGAAATEVELRAVPLRRLRGKLAGEAAPGGASVGLRRIDDDHFFMATARDDGSFVVGGLRAGVYEATFSPADSETRFRLDPPRVEVGDQDVETVFQRGKELR